MRLRPPQHDPTSVSASTPALPDPALQLRDALRQAAGRAAPFDVRRARAQLQELGQLGRRGLAALVDVLGQLSELRRDPAGACVADDFESHCQLAAIEAVALAARRDQQALAQAYRGARSPVVRDSLCEAAALVPDAGPELFGLMLEHLEENSFVAGLSLASHGNAAALPRLQATLWREADAAASAGLDRDAQSLRAVRVEGLIEAIETLGGRVPAQLEAQVAQAVARGRPALDPLLALVPPSAGRRPDSSAH